MARPECSDLAIVRAPCSLAPRRRLRDRPFRSPKPSSQAPSRDWCCRSPCAADQSVPVRLRAVSVEYVSDRTPWLRFLLEVQPRWSTSVTRPGGMEKISCAHAHTDLPPSEDRPRIKIQGYDLGLNSTGSMSSIDEY